jgi:hypothetical protein
MQNDQPSPQTPRMSGLTGMTDFFEKTKTALLWLPSKVIPIPGLYGNQTKLPDAIKPEPLLPEKKPVEERLDLINNAEVMNEIEDSDISEFLEDGFVQDAIKQGQDIGDYMKKIQSDLADVETDAVHQYFQNTEKFADLYNNLNSCDVTLEKIETTLHIFQTELSAITNQIQEMQGASVDKERKLSNRKKVSDELHRFVDEVNLDPTLVQAVTTLPINEAFIPYLNKLFTKLSYIDSMRGPDIIALKDIEPKLRDAKTKVCYKLYQWLLMKINTAVANLEVLAREQKQLMKYKFLFTFLFTFEADKAIDLVDNYCKTISSIYFQHFKNYLTAISRLQYEVATKNDLIGLEEETSRSLMGLFNPNLVKKNKSNVFALGTRYKKTLSDLEKPMEFPTANNNDKFQFEYLWRCVNYMLMHTVSEELLFTREFFQSNLSEKIFTTSVNLYLDVARNFLANSYDGVGVLLIYCMADKYKQIMHEHNEPGLDAYFDTLSNQLLQRFKFIFQQNVESVRNANLKNLGPIESGPHYVTRRFSEYLVALLFIAKSHPQPTQPFELQASLKVLSEEIDRLIDRMAHTTWTTRLEQLIFTLNNYDLIVQTTRDRNVTSEDVEKFEKSLSLIEEELVRLQLTKLFGSLTNYIRANTIEESDGRLRIVQPKDKIDVVKSVLKDFSKTWKKTIDELNSATIHNYANYKRGMIVMQKINTYVLNYYKALVEIIKAYYKDLLTSNYYVPETEITYEMRKYIIDQ